MQTLGATLAASRRVCCLNSGAEPFLKPVEEGFLAEFPALPLWTDALAADTDHLSHEEYGLYQRMLNTAWRMSSCDLPNDPLWLVKRFRLSTEEYDKICQPIIAEFWTVNSKNRLEQKRLKKERAYVKERSEKQRLRAKSRWDKQKDKSRGNAAPHVSGNAPTPTPTPIEDSAPNGAGRATRLADDWNLPDEWRDWATVEGWPVETVQFEAEKFRDCWHGAGGQKSRKVNWQATWRNWMRNVSKNGTGRNTKPSPHDKLMAGFAKAARNGGDAPP